MKYVVFSLSGDFIKTGFSSHEEARKYIADHCLCGICLNDLKRGYTEDYQGERYPVLTVFDTDCGIQMDIENQNDFDSQN